MNRPTSHLYALLALFLLLTPPSSPAQAVAEPRVRLDLSELPNSKEMQQFLASRGAIKDGSTVLIEADQLEQSWRELRNVGIRDDFLHIDQLLTTFGGFRTQRIISPGQAAAELARYEQTPRLRAIADHLRDSRYAPCDEPAAAYDRAAEANRIGERQRLGPQVDLHCLRSFFRWQRPNGLFETDDVPRLLQPGIGRGIKAMAILEMETLDRERVYICGALLLPGNRVKTAAHCFSENLLHQRALARGRLFVRLVRTPELPGWRVRPLSRDWNVDMQVANDVIELAFDAPSEVEAEPATFIEFSDAARPIVMGYFADFDTNRLVENVPTTTPVWYRGMRWSRPDLCYAINSANHCVRLLCQTINGFSGMPIFDQSSDHDGQALRVLGLVSRPDHPEAQCGQFLNTSTLAYTEISSSAHLSPSSAALSLPSAQPDAGDVP